MVERELAFEIHDPLSLSLLRYLFAELFILLSQPRDLLSLAACLPPGAGASRSRAPPFLARFGHHPLIQPTIANHARFVQPS